MLNQEVKVVGPPHRQPERNSITSARMSKVSVYCNNNNKPCIGIAYANAMSEKASSVREAKSPSPPPHCARYAKPISVYVTLSFGVGRVNADETLTFVLHCSA